MLPSLAAFTLPRFKIQLIDELVQPLDLHASADLVAVSAMVRHIPRSVEISQAFRRLGVKTIIGALAAHALFERVQGAFDRIMFCEGDTK